MTLLGSTVQCSFDLEYELLPTSTSVCITCTFLDSSTTGCVAVVHQRISKLSFSGLMNIESSHKFNRSGDTAYGCIEGVNLTDYQIGIIGSYTSTSELTTCNGQYAVLLYIISCVLKIYLTIDTSTDHDCIWCTQAGIFIAGT